MTSNTKENRIEIIDLLKTISIFLVLFAHFGRVNSRLWEGGESTYLSYFFSSLTTYAVPMFFIINGALLFMKPEKLTFSKMSSRIFQFLGIRFFYTFLGIGSEIIFLQQFYSKKELLDAIVYSPCDPFTFLWFIDALIGIYLFVPFFAKMYLQDNRSFYTFAGMVFLFSIIPYTYDNTVNVLLESYRGFSYSLSDAVNRFYFMNGRFTYSLFYFLAGAIIYRDREALCKKMKSSFMLAVSILLFLIWFVFCCWKTSFDKQVYDSMWAGYSTIFISISSLCLFLFFVNRAYRFPIFMNKIIKTIGSNTMGIYVLQGFVAVPYLIVTNQIPIENYAISCINSVVIMTICLGISMIMKRIPILRRLV